MPKPDKAARRDAQRHKARHGMRVSGRSIKSVILPLLGRDKKARKK